MRTLAIGDIHGCLTALEALADRVGFTEDDTIVTLGDYVDRGPETKGVVDFLIGLQRGGFRLVPLRGNHEIMMLEARHDPTARAGWRRVGGEEALRSYGSDSVDEIPATHWEFLETLLPYYETDRHLFVHANLDPDLALEDQPDGQLFWEPFGRPEPHVSGKTMICGHTSQKGGQIRDLGHAVCIDTYAWGGGWLTCLDVDADRYWQANHKGKTRCRQLR